MITSSLRRVGLAFAALALFLGARDSMAQGVTGAAVQGTVTRTDSTLLDAAQVQLRSNQTGQTYTAGTGANGRYFIDNVQPGGGYELTVRAIGFQPSTRGEISLAWVSVSRPTWR